jgi:hypothetical protein
MNSSTTLCGNRLLLWHFYSSSDMELRIKAAGYLKDDGNPDQHSYALALVEAMHDAYEAADNEGDVKSQAILKFVHSNMQ